jgi:uncharacterized protein involved in exopolysaccharide biosynthesis
MDFSPGWRVLKRYWLAVAVVGLLSMLAAYASSFLLSPSYGSAARVLVRAREVRYLNATGQDLSNQPGVIDSVLAKALTQTSSGLVRSQAVAEQVVNELHLDQPKPKDMALLARLRRAFRQAYKVALAYVRYGFYAEPPAYEGAVDWVQSAVTAQPVKDSYLIEIKARADDPELAAAIANSATRAFIDASRARVKQEAARYRAFLKGEVDAAQAKVSQAENDVRRYKEEKGITDIAEQRRLTAGALESGRKTLQDLDAQLDDARARLDAVKDNMRDLSPTDVSTTTVKGRNTASAPVSVTSTTEYESAPSQTLVETGRSSTTTRAEASSSTTRNESTTKQDSQAQSFEDRSSEAPNRVYQDIQSSSVGLQAEIAGLQARRDALATALAQRTDAGGVLPEQEARLSELQLQVMVATNAYTSLRASYESASANEAQQAEEVSLVDEAQPPVYPEKPWRWLFGLVGLLLGTVAGFALATLVDSNVRGHRRSGGRVPAPPGQRATPGPMPRPVMASRAGGAPVGAPRIGWRPESGPHLRPGSYEP